MRRILILLALLLALPGVAGAAEYNAASCSRADVFAAYQKCSSGDAVIIPAGSCTWSSGIIADKSVSFKGAGKGSTVLYGTFGTKDPYHPPDNSWFFLIIPDSDAKLVQVSGMTLRSDGTTAGVKIGDTPYSSKDPESFRITDMKMDKLAACISTWGSTGVNGMGGVIDHNDFLNPMTTCLRHIGDCYGGWNRAAPLGTKEGVYVEDNTFMWDQDVFGPDYKQAESSTGIITTSSGGRWILRFNDIHSDYEDDPNNGAYVYTGTPDIHGFCYSGGVCPDNDRRGGYGTEYYYNAVYYEHAWGGTSTRGGTNMIFFNTVTGFTVNPNYPGDVHLRNYRSFSATCGGNAVGLCQDNEGYPCKDQIFDTYIWGDTINGNKARVYVDSADSVHIKPNRDYWDYTTSFTGASGVGMGTRANRPSTCTAGVGYWSTDQGEWDSTHPGPDGTLDRCASTNTWTNAWYTPYQYPHPLTLSGPSPDPTCHDQGHQCCDFCETGSHSEYDGDCPGQSCCDSCGTAVRELALDLRMDEGSGTQASDSSGKGNDAALLNGPEWVPGRAGGQALHFDGIDDYVQVPDSLSLDPGYLTVSMWFKADSLADNAGLIAKGDASHRQYWAWVYQGSLSLEIDEGGLRNSVFPLDTGKWHHLAFTYDGSSITTYLDGEEVSDMPQPTGPILADDDPLLIGALPGFGHFAGTIDDVRVYNYALTDQEVRGIYLGTEGLVLHLPLDEGSGSAAADSSGSGNDGVVSGAEWAAGRVGSHALAFGGTGYINVSDSPSMDFGKARGTISMWLNPDNPASGSRQTLALGSDGAGGYSIELALQDDGDLFFYPYYDSSDWHAYNLVTNPLAAGEWQHLAVTWDYSSKEVRIFVNGAEQPLAEENAPDYWTTIASTGDWHIGGSPVKGQWFSGSIDDVRVYNYALSPEGVLALFRQASPHRADTSGDGCVDDPELMAFISHFYLDSTAYPMGELMDAVGLWKAGC